MFFIAANEHSVTGYLPAFIKNAENLKTILTTAHPVKNDIEGRVRSARHAKKLTSRLYSDNPNITFDNPADEDGTKKVAEIFRKGPIQRLDISIEAGNVLSENTKNVIKTILQKRKDEIYVLNIQKCPLSLKLRHAEEFLTDIAEYADKVRAELDVAQPLYTCIAGKKRPCMGCSGRMHNVITQYGERPGRYWSNTLENQKDDVASATVTLLLSKPAHVSLCKDGKEARDYDSGSDSELEENLVKKTKKAAHKHIVILKKT